MIKFVPRPARTGRVHLTIFAAAVVAALALAPVAGATYPGRNGSVAYQFSVNNGSVQTESAISSIPNGSAVNCQGTNSDGSTICDIGRFLPPTTSSRHSSPGAGRSCSPAMPAVRRTSTRSPPTAPA